jgi:hypothetical protein
VAPHQTVYLSLSTPTDSVGARALPAVAMGAGGPDGPHDS